MTIGIHVSGACREIGSGDFLHGFFSTITGNLEHGWGHRFPVLMNELYSGSLVSRQAQTALIELEIVRHELSALPVSRLVWDFENPNRRPPWGDNISPDITDLSNYFVTSDGKDLISVLVEALTELRDKGGTAVIQ